MRGRLWSDGSAAIEARPARRTAIAAGGDSRATHRRAGRWLGEVAHVANGFEAIYPDLQINDVPAADVALAARENLPFRGNTLKRIYHNRDGERIREHQQYQRARGSSGEHTHRAATCSRNDESSDRPFAAHHHGLVRGGEARTPGTVRSSACPARRGTDARGSVFEEYGGGGVPAAYPPPGISGDARRIGARGTRKAAGIFDAPAHSLNFSADASAFFGPHVASGTMSTVSVGSSTFARVCFNVHGMWSTRDRARGWTPGAGSGRIRPAAASTYRGGLRGMAQCEHTRESAGHAGDLPMGTL